MKNVIRQVLKQIQEDKRKRRRMGSALLVLSLLVITGVVWQLRLTGITMTSEALCGQLEHQHGEQCVETVLVCQQEDHEHTDECYESHYVCGFETEHTHTVLCYSDANADRETAQDWESTLPSLSGRTSADLAAVAMSQVGYAESAQNYHVADDGQTLMGYTRYGAWYGNEYGNWNAMFVSFCLNYSQHPAYEALVSGSPETMRQNAQSLERLRDASYTPAAGDLVFVDKNADGAADTVAIVTDADAAQVCAVEGDREGAVQTVAYLAEDILAYAQLSDSDNAVALTAEDGNITVRFVIADEIYTNDNDTTHVTVNTTDGFSEELTYTSWAKRYKVTGTGKLMEFEIPTGTTLAASNYSTPSINVENIGSNYTTSYANSITWITESGMICNADTVLTQDTTLKLHLNPSSAPRYNLVWACNCTGEVADAGKHVVVSPSVNPTIASGQSVAANFLPTAEQANAFAPGTGCNVGAANGKVFTGWYVKNRLTGEEVAFTAGTPLIDAYCDAEPQGGNNNLYVYAHWRSENAVMVTATFLYGDRVVATREVEQGAALGTLPAAPEYTGEENMVFRGWQIQGQEGYATSDTVVSEDMTLVAVFTEAEEAESYDVYLHDIAPDGEETNQDGVESISLLIPAGESVLEYMDGVFDDGKFWSQCVWYTRSGDTRTRYDLTAPVNGELHLYTYSYQIQLTLDSQSTESTAALSMESRVTVEQDGTTLTLTLREGEHPTYSDFVIDGVDYSLYSWTVNGETLDISEIVANGVTENVTATGTANTNLTGVSVNFYVSINNEWKKLDDKSGTFQEVKSGDRYYISAAQLETAYGDYGFRAENLITNPHVFAHVDTTGTAIWHCNITTLEGWNGLFVQGLKHNDHGCDYYYLPANTTAFENGNNGTNRDNFRVANSFYTTTIRDNAGIYVAGETVPETETFPLVFHGETATITLKTPTESDQSWSWNDQQLVGTDNGDGTTTYTIENVTNEIVITSPLRPGSFLVKYAIGTLPNVDTIQSARPALEGKDTWTDIISESTNYVLRTPDVIRYTHTGNHSLVTVVFRGWDADNDSTVDLPAGRNMTDAELSHYATDGVVNLKGIWEDLGYHSSVSFYIDLEMEVLNYEGSTSDTFNENFTDVLYGTQVEIDPFPTETNYANGIVFQAPSAAHTADIDAEIRSMVKGVKGTFLNQERTFTLASFPEDEEMLGQIRDKQAKYIAAYEAWKAGLAEGADNSVSAYRNSTGKPKIIWDGENYIPVESITSKDYTIRWYVFKYEYNNGGTGENGWHIDGVLVKKSGQLTITKSFAGDAAAIEAVKPNYSIAVTWDDKPRYSLNLGEYSEENLGGYVNYNEETNTYVWKITLNTSKTYNLKEVDYQYSENGIQTVADYKITNGSNNVVRTSYSDEDGINVTAEAYSVDTDYMSYQTVSLFNTYLHNTAVLLRKVDDSDRVLAGVGFQLYEENSTDPLMLYQATDGNYYLSDGADRTATTDLTTNALGQIMLADLKGHSGTYVLRETAPLTGYLEIADITLTVNEDGTVIANDKKLEGGITLKITNTSKTMDVTVNKIWTDDTNLPVKVNLCLNGTLMSGKDYEVQLNADVNWTHTWQNLPRYVGGAEAVYSIRETWIGDTAYNGDLPDGYSKYLVTYVEPTYRYDESKTEVTAVSLTVKNRVATGNVEFTKTDHHGVALAGAQFQLYEDEDCTKTYGSPVVSDTSGKVAFNALTTGTYYMKETQSPNGFAPNDKVYVVTVNSGSFTIREKDGTENILIITNTPAQAALRVRKVDDKGNVLTGASFQLFRKDGDDWVQYAQDGKNTFSVDENGLIAFDSLEDGAYYLEEAEAPAGYYRLTEKIYFNITDGVVSAKQGKGVTYWHFDAATEDASACIIVTNVAGQELPKTGGMGTQFGTLVGLLMMASSLYVIMLRRKRERGQV